MSDRLKISNFIEYHEKDIFNADMRKSNADIRRFLNDHIHICDHLRTICENLRLRYIFKGVFIIFISILLSGCVTIYNPATQRKETLLIDTESEVALGKDIDRQIQKKFKVLENPQMQYRLDYIGERLAGSSDRQDIIYHFRIIKDKELNAFAIPGGFIYVNSQVLGTANDDELACVLGHEIGHIAARHSVKKLQAVLGYRVIMDIALGISGRKHLGRAVDIVFTLVSLGYSRKDELLADKLSVRYARRAGFNPYGMITFLEKLKKEADERGPNFNLVFLSSHPPYEERIKVLKDEIVNVSGLSDELP